MKPKSGTLFVVATPIGNLGDITFRAVEILRKVDAVACEDTRHTGSLLTHLGIDRRLISCHDFNERRRTGSILSLLEEGQDVALVTDAGTPMVSDPGAIVVREAAARGFTVVPVPGPCAAAAALSACHVPSDRFLFLGFPPAKSGERRRLLESVAGLPYSLVFYEAPHRILKTLEDLEMVLGDREAMLGREMTKLYEELLRGSLSSIRSSLEARSDVRGEMVLVVEGADERAQQQGVPEEGLREAWTALVAKGASKRELVSELGRRFGIPRNRLYRLMLEWEAGSGESGGEGERP